MSDLSDLSDKMGAPVFALTGYAVASLGIARGLAVPRWGGTQGADVPQGKTKQIRRRDSKSQPPLPRVSL